MPTSCATRCTLHATAHHIALPTPPYNSIHPFIKVPPHLSAPTPGQVYGHSHCYERYYPVHNLTVLPGGGTTEGVYLDPGATVHVTSGAGLCCGSAVPTPGI